MSGFRIGLCVSLCVHSLLAFSIYYFGKPEIVSVKTQNIAPLVLSLNNFVEKKEIETIMEQTPPLPPKPKKIKEKPKPKPVVEKPALEVEKVVEEIAEETTEEIAEVVSETEKVVDTNEILAEQKVAQAAALRNEEDLIARIVAAINKYKGYPDRARRMNIEGVVYVEFLVTKNGEVIDPKVVKSSGYKILDTHTIKSIKTAAIEFPDLPKDLKIKAPVNYSLKYL